jgi:transmembrane sensor
MWKPENIEDLIGKFIVGEASEKEIRDLKDWCALSPENQKYLDDAILIFEKTQLSDEFDFDEEKAWEKVKNQISDTKAKKRFSLPVWGIAASLALILTFTFLIFSPYYKSTTLLYASGGEVLTQLLPDQTEMTLNRNSTVEVIYNERKKTGTIQVSGEVLVSIPETKKVEWIVQTGDLLIRDIGTVFLVKSYPEDDQVEVTVEEGEVQFYSQTQVGITLLAGEKGTYKKAKQEFSKSLADSNVTAFKTLSFTFSEQELKKVAEDLSVVYNREIVLDGDIAACKITVDFENEDLETILGILAETMSLEIAYQGDLIRISGDGCY